MTATQKAYPRWFAGEFLGTFIIIFFGCGAGAMAMLAPVRVGVLPVAIGWGSGVALAITVVKNFSEAHLNPAVTIAAAAWAGFPWKKIPGYVAAQFTGAFAASAALYLVLRGPLLGYEKAHGILRGSAGSEATAMVFGEFFPNPGGAPWTDALRATISPAWAFVAEILGTGILAAVVFSGLGNFVHRRAGVPAAVTIGVTIMILITILGPWTMACFNPARDLAPRLFSYFAGWGPLVFSANGSGWWLVYVVAPILGALAGGGLARWILALCSPANKVTPDGKK